MINLLVFLVRSYVHINIGTHEGADLKTCSYVPSVPSEKRTLFFLCASACISILLSLGTTRNIGTQHGIRGIKKNTT